jgi:hypothetical protein
MTENALKYLLEDDDRLLDDCDVHIYKASGPGGQHRNKVSSAVRLKHRPTGITATANDSRSQHDNRRRALRRMRMNLALRLRSPRPPGEIEMPDMLRECLHEKRKGPDAGKRFLQVGRKDSRYWAISAFVLDLLEGAQGRLAPAAERMGISTGNLTSLLKADRHALAAAQEIRRSHGQKPIR